MKRLHFHPGDQELETRAPELQLQLQDVAPFGLLVFQKK